MPNRTAQEDSWDSDDDWESDLASPQDLEASDEIATVPCPRCKRPLPEDAPRCPYCESYVSAEDAPPGRKPWWIIIGVLLVLFVVYRWIMQP